MGDPLLANIDVTTRIQVRNALDRHVRNGLISGLNQSLSGSVNFVQIGGNDGKLADPLLQWHSKNPWKGLIIEPVPIYFEKLKALHSNNLNIQTANCAISKEDGHLDLWHVDPIKEDKYPRHAPGLASVSLQHLLNHKIDKDDCTMLRVPCLSASTVLKHYDIKRIDLLCIDTEGHESAIIENFPFDDVDVEIVIFEAWHMPLANRDVLVRLCNKYNRSVCFFWSDGYIVKNSDLLRSNMLREMAEFYTEI